MVGYSRRTRSGSVTAMVSSGKEPDEYRSGDVGTSASCGYVSMRRSYFAGSLVCRSDGIMQT